MLNLYAQYVIQGHLQSAGMLRANRLFGPCMSLLQAPVWVTMELAAPHHYFIKWWPRLRLTGWLYGQLAVTIHLFPETLLSVTTQCLQYPCLQATNPSCPEASLSPDLLTAAQCTSTPLWLAHLHIVFPHNEIICLWHAVSINLLWATVWMLLLKLNKYTFFIWCKLYHSVL